MEQAHPFLLPSPGFSRGQHHAQAGQCSGGTDSLEAMRPQCLGPELYPGAGEGELSWGTVGLEEQEFGLQTLEMMDGSILLP